MVLTFILNSSGIGFFVWKTKNNVWISLFHYNITYNININILVLNIVCFYHFLDTPKILIPPRTAFVMIGQSHNFTCIATGHPKPSLTWSYKTVSLLVIIGYPFVLLDAAVFVVNCTYQNEVYKLEVFIGDYRYLWIFQLKNCKRMENS